MNKRSVHTPNRRRRHRDADRMLLVEAAERIFSQRGYHSASIRHVAQDAGFSVGGVYQFFKSKDELYLAVIDEQWAHFFEAIDPAFQASGFKQQIEALTTAWLSCFETRRAFFQIYLSDRVRFSGAFRDRVAKTVCRNQTELRKRIEQLMQSAIEAGALRFSDACFVASAFIGVLHDQVFEALAANRTPARPEDVVALFLQGAAMPDLPARRARSRERPRE